MHYFTINRDFETAERVGAVGTFQVIATYDHDDNELPDFIDAGTHFHSCADVAQYVAKKLGVPVGDVSVEPDDEMGDSPEEM